MWEIILVISVRHEVMEVISAPNGVEVTHGSIVSGNQAARFGTLSGVRQQSAH